MTVDGQSFDPRRDRPGPRAARIAEMLRVDHAGEYGAVRIYRGQRAVLDASPQTERTAALVAEMEASEKAHLERFDALLADTRTRPTLLSPIWDAAGFALGAATALLGEKAAMACTEAVEDVIEEHYARQAEELDVVDPDLAARLRGFRDDELAHKRLAESEGAREAPAYELLSAVIRAGCRVAIRLSEKI
jgi:ubiquinone biosynthesis monooxygenase Coq7